ncbi:DUF4236 domain-containing protein [Mycobacterium sherrisii]|uniref:DUF4236 domain-containing protein n=1 Tax=Mycobacterium sherrisii TaxID=243061 RepID=UPI002DDC9E10|nr:DUF4236 domain-containing protein [Mycobacterium sherrisii]MEC4764772.1 DUF4236 domain-containing protein [Mycobacterium sherrisii]
MGAFRFRKQFKLAPGLKVTLNKRSVSATLGVRGMHVTHNTKGQRTTSVGIPGTGLSWRDTSKVGATRPAQPTTIPNFDPVGLIWESIGDALWKAGAAAVAAIDPNEKVWSVSAIASWEPRRRSAGTLTIKMVGTAHTIPIDLSDLTQTDRWAVIGILEQQAPEHSLWLAKPAGCRLMGRFSDESSAFAAEKEMMAKQRAEAD